MKEAKPKLLLDWATHEAAKYACEKWHYSKCMPAGKNVKVGVWENDQFIGVVIFAMGSNASICALHGKTAELARIALKVGHKTEVTRIMSIALKMLRKKCPNLNAVVSYADLDRHKGTIYVAGNWKLEHESACAWISIKGKKTHPRSINARYGTRSISWLRKHVDPNAHRVETAGKKRFVWKFSKRAGSKDNVAAPDQGAEGGVIPTPALHSSVLV